MTASNDTTNGPGATPIHDQRATPRGVLPRQLQMWLMIGLAVIILAIILFTGHAAPAPRASAAIRTSDPSLLAPDRIQTYQRQLADDEARLRRELAQAPGPARSGAPTTRCFPNSVYPTRCRHSISTAYLGAARQNFWRSVSAWAKLRQPLPRNTRKTITSESKYIHPAWAACSRISMKRDCATCVSFSTMRSKSCTT